MGAEASKMGSETSDMGAEASKMGSETSDMGAEAFKMGSETSDMGAETSPIGLNFKKIFDSLDSAMRQDGPECQPDTIGGIVKNPPEGVPDLKKVKVALLNAHSINKKLENIRDLITENNLDVFLITETWLKFVTGNDDIRQALPETFQYHHEPRQGQRGGGVAITFKNSFRNHRVLLHNSNRYSTFEYVAAKLQDSEWEDPVLFINVYCPSRIRWELINRNSTKFQKFLNEFQELLNKAHTHQKIIVTGDFNVWYDDDNVKKTREFKSFLITNNLVQFVASKTHNKGHILDLVITRNVNIDFLYVENEEMSDHYTVYFNILGKKKKTESSEN